MRLIALLLAVSVVVTASAAPVPKQLKAKRPDAEVFVGAWEVVEPNGGPPKHVWTFDPDLTMWSKPVGSSGKGSEWKIRIDAEKAPKEIDIGKEYKGIYEIDGDEIRILYSGTRPASLDERRGQVYTVIRRVKGDGK